MDEAAVKQAHYLRLVEECQNQTRHHIEGHRLMVGKPDMDFVEWQKRMDYYVQKNKVAWCEIIEICDFCVEAVRVEMEGGIEAFRPTPEVRAAWHKAAAKARWNKAIK